MVFSCMTGCSRTWRIKDGALVATTPDDDGRRSPWMQPVRTSETHVVRREPEVGG